MYRYRYTSYTFTITKSLSLKILGQPWIFISLVRVGHMYYFPPFYSI